MYGIDAGVLRLLLDGKGLVKRLTLTGCSRLSMLSEKGVGMWSLLVEDGRGVRRLRPEEASGFRLEEKGCDVYLDWGACPGGIRVRAVLSRGMDGLDVTLSVGKEPGTKLLDVEFPIVGPLPFDKGFSLAVPEGMGIEILDPGFFKDGEEKLWRYPAPLSMQFTAYSFDGTGLMMVARDPVHRAKGLKAVRRGEGLYLSFTHTPENLATGLAVYSVPYAVWIGSAEDWMDAAAKYKKRFRAVPGEGAGQERPGWVRDVDLWVWNRGAVENIVKPVERLRRLAPELRIAVMWYWWHANPYDLGMPEYLPPRDRGFRDAVKRLHELGVPVIVYVNGRLWDCTTAGWLRARRYATKDRRGEVYVEHYNRFLDHPLAVMCPATGFWRETLAGIVERLVKDYGVDGVYIDQVAAAPPLDCFDPAHGHPLGGGSHWVEGYRALAEEVRRRCGRPVALATEGCSEAFIGCFDLFLTLDNSSERYGRYKGREGLWRPIPLFNAVYHGYAVTYGSYASLEDEPPYDPLWPPGRRPSPSRPLDYTKLLQFSLEEARAFVWGSTPTVHHLTLASFKEREALRFLLCLTRLRRLLKKFLLWGEWIPFKPCVEPLVKVRFLRRTIYTMPNEVSVVEGEHPAVLCSAWRFGEELCVVMVNYTSHTGKVCMGRCFIVTPRSAVAIVVKTRWLRL